MTSNAPRYVRYTRNPNLLLDLLARRAWVGRVLVQEGLGFATWLLIDTQIPLPTAVTTEQYRLMCGLGPDELQRGAALRRTVSKLRKHLGINMLKIVGAGAFILDGNFVPDVDAFDPGLQVS